MLTTEQYNKIMKQKAMLIINACITTKDNPNASTFYGNTNSTRNSLVSFDKTLVEQYIEKIIDIYKDLPRKQVALLMVMWHLQIFSQIHLIPKESPDNVLSGANAVLNMHIPTREAEEKRKIY